MQFGTADSDPQYRIEYLAKNVMNFRCPDERGNTPQNTPICGNLETTTNLQYPETMADTLCASLAAKNHDVRKSKSAGEYICNYIFYRGCEMRQDLETNCERSGHTLFVHFPAFRNVDEEK